MVSIENTAAWQEAVFQHIPMTVFALLTLVMVALYIYSITKSQKILYQFLAIGGITWTLCLWKGLPEAWKILRQKRI